MKIRYLCLKNFASVFTAMKRKKIEIDFTKSKNRVILFVGPNGSGKTSILSALHPFAYPGSMDIRNNEDLILENVDGYKEIHIQDGDIIYVIKHHYIWSKNGRSTKSFITKDGVELNPNGNVNSFKEIVQMELSLELDYLKLIRLGSNVTNFIDMKATERKNFTSDLLSDIDIYTQFYKKINDDARLLKSVLKSVSDKIEKLRILDEKEIEDKIVVLELELEDLKKQRDEENGQIYKIDGTLNALVPEGVEDFFFNLRTKDEEYKRINKEIQIKQSDINKFDIFLIGSIENTINSISDEITKNESTINMNVNMINFFFTQLDKFYTQKKEREDSLKYITSDSEYGKLNEMYLELHREKEKLDKIYKNYEPKCTKDDMLSALRLMQEIDTFISNIHSFNHDAVVEVINRINNKDNIDDFVKRQVLSIDDKLSKYNVELMSIGNAINAKGPIYVMFKPTNCGISECPYLNFYHDNVGKEDSTTEKINAEIKKLENKREYYLSMSDINKNIDYILLLIKTNKSLIDKMPEDFFSIKNILNAIKDCIPFYDEDKITNYIAVLEEYEYYKELSEKIKEVKKEIIFIEKNANTITTIQNELMTIDIEIDKLQKDIENLKKENELLEKRNNKLTKTKEIYIEYKQLKDEINENKEEADRILKDINSMKEIEKKIQDSVNIKRLHLSRIEQLNSNIKRVENEITDLRFKLKEFKALNEEKRELDFKFDEINIMRESLSSREGIPLLFIQLYLKNTTILVNNLLNTVYKGTLEIEDFDINEKEFKIPYVKNGVRVSDVIYTSQGEKSFVSLALSFALIEQSIKRYNILLLDEIDATLDQTNRAMFLAILEKQLEAIGSEQVFLITHNNMFDNYPVDIIMTADVQVDNYRNMNIIWNGSKNV